MKQISVANLTPGMVAAKTVFSGDNQIIVPKGTIFTQNIIARLESYYIYYVSIDDLYRCDLLNAFIRQQCSAVNISDSQRRLLASFNRFSEQYRSILMGLIHKNESFCFEELLNELMNIPIYEDDVSNILFCIGNTENSVYNHCITVSLLTAALSKWLNFSKEDCMLAAACGLFHDAGKLFLPNGVFKNPGKPTPEEFNIIKTHTIEGFHFLSKFEAIPDAVKNAVLMHHERCDGSGYPYCLSYNEISKFAKAVMIADDFDNMLRRHTGHASVSLLSFIMYFEKEGLLKFDKNYLLTFLKHILDSCLKNTFTLDYGMSGTVIFINSDISAAYNVSEKDNQTADSHKEYYDNILRLSSLDKLSIETII